ncbi:low molecular weight phosphotyrosine protein phosphatase [Endozoicomonas sp.]|nr:low molecular weight phosphotyrosine protein phosphatase [Endozoicomonas sp.]
MIFSNILMVCVGNICRSPTAEYLLKQQLQQKGSKASVASAGLGALVDKPAAPKAIELAEALHLDLTPHRAQQLTRELIKPYDLVLVMEQAHIKAVEAVAPESRGKVHLLGRWQQNVEIPDPYQKGIAAYQLALALIQTTTAQWAQKLI